MLTQSRAKVMRVYSRFRMMLEQTPRLFLETIIVSIVLITMLIIIFQGNDTTQIVSTMALFVMAAFQAYAIANSCYGHVDNHSI